MKKQTQLLSALALSVGLTLSASFQAVASIPGQVADQAPSPVWLNAGKSASGSGERTGGRNGQSGTENPGRIQKFLVMIYRINLHNPSKV